MEKSSDILIVGGGIIGLSCGWQLLKDGHSVTIIDAAHPLPAQTTNAPLAPASLAAAGMLAPSFEFLHSPNNTQNKFYNYCFKSNELWKSFHLEVEAESHLSVDYRNEGTITLHAPTSNDRNNKYNELQDFYQILLGLDQSSQWLKNDDLFHLEPNLSPDCIAGIFSPDEKQVDPVLVHQALSRIFVKHGGNMVRGWTVIKLLHANGKITGALSRPSRDNKAGSEASKREDAKEVIHSSPIVILASGAALSGIECDFEMPHVFPVKGEALALDMAGASLGPGHTRPSPRHVIRQNDVYICPKSNGRAIIGATSLPHIKTPDINARAIQKLRSSATNLFPHFLGLKEHSRWMGFRPATANGLPVIGPLNSNDNNITPEGLLFAIGHYRNGILLAPATAQTISECINSSQIKNKDIAFYS